MIAGILLIICGVLIAVYPPLLALIVASVLIVLGVLTILVAREFRKQQSGHRRIEIVEHILRY